jgi:hypothetical protein
VERIARPALVVEGLGGSDEDFVGAGSAGDGCASVAVVFAGVCAGALLTALVVAALRGSELGFGSSAFGFGSCAGSA